MILSCRICPGQQSIPALLYMMIFPNFRENWKTKLHSLNKKHRPPKYASFSSYLLFYKWVHNFEYIVTVKAIRFSSFKMCFQFLRRNNTYFKTFTFFKTSENNL